MDIIFPVLIISLLAASYGLWLGLRIGIESDNSGASSSREQSMVVLRRKADGTPAVWCDPEIADLVAALNAGGVPTVASCSGHGKRPGNIALSDGRELIIAKDFSEARSLELPSRRWLPMEIAPRGRIVLLYTNQIELGLWDSRGWWTDPDEEYRLPEPTHWMPLPEPPEAAK